jgi:hypothetical protein
LTVVSDVDLTDADPGYRTNTRGQVAIEAKNDNEFVTLASKTTLRANNDNPNRGTDFSLEETYLQIGGLHLDQFYERLMITMHLDAANVISIRTQAEDNYEHQRQRHE